eukprot:17968-Heterococcus_DN1.PRE.1
MEPMNNAESEKAVTPLGALAAATFETNAVISANSDSTVAAAEPLDALRMLAFETANSVPEASESMYTLSERNNMQHSAPSSVQPSRMEPIAQLAELSSLPVTQMAPAVALEPAAAAAAAVAEEPTVADADIIASTAATPQAVDASLANVAHRLVSDSHAAVAAAHDASMSSADTATYAADNATTVQPPDHQFAVDSAASSSDANAAA